MAQCGALAVVRTKWNAVYEWCPLPFARLSLMLWIRLVVGDA